MDIESILKSKPNSGHYLRRYISFIQSRQQRSVDIQCTSYEVHHICPKALDMFPEYTNLTNHPWNGLRLTLREHYVAHLLLWKAYNNKSMTLTVYFMKKLRGVRMTSRLYEQLKVRRSMFLKEQNSRINKGKVNVVDDSGYIKKISIDEFNNGGYNAQHKGTVVVKIGDLKMRIPKDDPRLATGELAGHTKGMTFAYDASGNSFYVSSDDPRMIAGTLKGNHAGTITITNGISNRRIKPHDDIPTGWSKGMTKKSPINSFWINDGINSRMVHNIVDIPFGWVRGRPTKRD